MNFNQISDRKQNGFAMAAIADTSKDRSIGSYSLTEDERVVVLAKCKKRGVYGLVAQRNAELEARCKKRGDYAKTQNKEIFGDAI